MSEDEKMLSAAMEMARYLFEHEGPLRDVRMAQNVAGYEVRDHSGRVVGHVAFSAVLALVRAREARAVQ